jgi:hypothetical protein
MCAILYEKSQAKHQILKKQILISEHKINFFATQKPLQNFSKMLRRKIISLVKLSFHIASAMERRSRSKERFIFWHCDFGIQFCLGFIICVKKRQSFLSLYIKYNIPSI